MRTGMHTEASPARLPRSAGNGTDALANGQTVEAIITPTARPNPAWLSFVVTAKARSSIRHYLKHLQREEAILLGKRLLEKALLGRIGGIGELQAAEERHGVHPRDPQLGSAGERLGHR